MYTSILYNFINCHARVLKGCKYKTSSWHLNRFPDADNIGSTVVVVVVVVSHIQRIGCQPEKTTLHGTSPWPAPAGVGRDPPVGV